MSWKRKKPRRRVEKAMKSPTVPTGPNLPKAFEKALLGGLAGLVGGFVEDVTGSNKGKWDEVEVDVSQHNSARRETIAAQVLAALSGNIAAPLDQPDRLVSMAVDLANKLIARLDEDAKKDRSAFNAYRRQVEEDLRGQQVNPQAVAPHVNLTANPFAPNPFAPNPFKMNNNAGQEWPMMPPSIQGDEGLVSP